jgi:hypothetical protein
MAGVLVELGTRRFAIPFECTCCGAAPTSEVSVPPLFPFCKRCVDHVRAAETANLVSTAIMLLGILCALVLAFVTGVLVALAVFAVAAIVAWSVRMWRRSLADERRGPSCASTMLAVRASNTAPRAFVFESPTFAARFAELNRAILTNATGPLQRILDGYHRARLAVPTPAVAAGIAPPPLNHREWLARIEATEGTLARREQLRRALDMTDDATERRALIELVARHELAHVLERPERIADALRTLDDDNASEELEQVERELLETASGGTRSG